MIALTEYHTFTTLISKKLIGISKSVTMRSLDYIHTHMNNVNYKPEELCKTFTEYMDILNTKYVSQPAIDIQKWSNNLRAVARTVLLSYTLLEAYQLVLEAQGHMSFVVFAKLREHVVNARWVIPYRTSYGTTKYEVRDPDAKLDTSGFPEYLKIIFDQIELRKFVKSYVEETGITHYKFVYSDTIYKLKPTEIEELVELLNPEGKFFKAVEEHVETLMEGFDKSKLSSL
jgi:hypothetical protein